MLSMNAHTLQDVKLMLKRQTKIVSQYPNFVLVMEMLVLTLKNAKNTQNINVNLLQVSPELANANLICIIKFVEIYCAQKLIKAKIKMRNAKNVQMLQIIWFLIMIARPIKKDVSQQEKDVF